MFAQDTIPLNGLLTGYEAALTRMGYSIATKLALLKNVHFIIRKHEDEDLTYLEPRIIIGYVLEIDEKFLGDGMTKHYYNYLRSAIERFVNYASSGQFDRLTSILRGARQKLSSEFQKIAEGFLSGDFHDNTRCDMRWFTQVFRMAGRARFLQSERC